MNSRLQLPHFWLVVGAPVRIRLVASPSTAFTDASKGLHKTRQRVRPTTKTLEMHKKDEGNKSAMQTPDQVSAFKWGLSEIFE